MHNFHTELLKLDGNGKSALHLLNINNRLAAEIVLFASTDCT